MQNLGLTWHDVSQGRASWKWEDLVYSVQSCNQTPSLNAGTLAASRPGARLDLAVDRIGGVHGGWVALDPSPAPAARTRKNLRAEAASGAHIKFRVALMLAMWQTR